jgi:hypothetical protein
MDTHTVGNIPTLLMLKQVVHIVTNRIMVVLAQKHMNIYSHHREAGAGIAQSV